MHSGDRDDARCLVNFPSVRCGNPPSPVSSLPFLIFCFEEILRNFGVKINRF